jgi:hypothetical protein
MNTTQFPTSLATQPEEIRYQYILQDLIFPGQHRYDETFAWLREMSGRTSSMLLYLLLENDMIGRRSLNRKRWRRIKLPSVATIERELGMNQSKQWRALSDLRKLGLVTVRIKRNQRWIKINFDRTAELFAKLTSQYGIERVTRLAAILEKREQNAPEHQISDEISPAAKLVFGSRISQIAKKQKAHVHSASDSFINKLPDAGKTENLSDGGFSESPLARGRIMHERTRAHTPTPPRAIVRPPFRGAHSTSVFNKRKTTDRSRKQNTDHPGSEATTSLLESTAGKDWANDAAQKLASILFRNRHLVPSAKIKNWHNDIRKIVRVDGFDEHTVTATLDWYVENYGKSNYTPVADSGRSFRAKFPRILAARKRAVGPALNDAPTQSVGEMRRRGWRSGRDVYLRDYYRYVKLPPRNERELYRIQAHQPDNCPPRNWLVVVHRSHRDAIKCKIKLPPDSRFYNTLQTKIKGRTRHFAIFELAPGQPPAGVENL